MSFFAVAASVGGALLSSRASSKAAKGQQAATDKADATQRYIYDNNVRLNQPAIDAGNLGRNRLQYLLGLGGGGGGGGESRAAVRARLLPQFTSGGTPGTPGTQASNVPLNSGTPQPGMVWNNVGREDGGYWSNVAGPSASESSRIPGTAATPATPATPGTVDEAGLQAAIDAQSGGGYGNNGAGGGPNDPEYGSLSRNFTGADLATEPGYQFGLNEGYKGLDRRALAGGSYFSGQALKAAQRFGQDYAGTKYGEAFNRDNTNKTRTYNQLSTLGTGGQIAANQVQTAGTNWANQTGENQTANANAQGAAGIAQANTWGNALNSGAKAYQDYNTQNSLLNNLQGGGTWANNRRNE